jgi:hypothetical protein
MLVMGSEGGDQQAPDLRYYWRHTSFVGIGQEFTERLDERRQIVLDGVPDYRGPQVPVGMNREIPQVDHLAPWDIGIAASDFRGDVICRFSDNREVVDHGIHYLLVVFEGVKINVRNVAPDFADRIEDVLDPESSISMRHRRLPAECDLSTLV